MYLKTFEIMTNPNTIYCSCSPAWHEAKTYGWYILTVGFIIPVGIVMLTSIIIICRVKEVCCI